MMDDNESIIKISANNIKRDASQAPISLFVNIDGNFMFSNSKAIRSQT